MSVHEVLDQYRRQDNVDFSALERDLIAREDNIADQLRLAGVQFGLYSEIVAEVLAQVGLGSPVDEATRQHIRARFVELMERLRREHGHGNNG